ncbi:MAG: hypothetical protein Q4A31_05010 [Corynebacterium sp.]|uniref:hypothetical protein n=1 Tax=Corynebacterium sp. TaxID=1720 RepID=UPI0026DD5D75|nr:hypothetical protein [Corynebacterium sp.]MDO4761257.1 hypothetical protein [Corynebacterium sp.]
MDFSQAYALLNRTKSQPWLDAEIARVGDAQWGAMGREIMGVAVDDPLLWANRMVELENGQWALCGIRFRGGDVAKPFVDIIAHSLIDGADHFAVCAPVLAEYAAFQPLGMRIFVSGQPEASWCVDRLIVSGTLKDVAQVPAVNKVEVVSADSAQLACDSAEIYAEIFRSRPEHASFAAPVSAEELASCMGFQVVIDGQKAGVIACEYRQEREGEGFVVIELCLNSTFRGRGFAPAVHREMVRKILGAGYSESTEYFGHIDPRNKASFSTAIAAGRKVTGAFVWSDSRLMH